MSETFITDSMACYVRGKVGKKGYYETTSWKNTNETAELIAQKSGFAVRLPTEAEWEYAACSSVQNLLFIECNGWEYCSDFFNNFEKIDGVVDPIGPLKGSFHVSRQFLNNRSKNEGAKFDRVVDSYITRRSMRLVIKVKDVKF